MREGLHSKLRTLLTLLFYHHVLPLVYNIFTYVFVNSFSPHWEIIADHVTTIPSPSQISTASDPLVMHVVVCVLILVVGVLEVEPQTDDCDSVFQSQLLSCPLAAFADCCQIQDFVSPQKSGLFKIRDICESTSPSSKKLVYCDMETDGGGWIVIQRRLPGGTENFTRKWADYENGFGDMSGEFWLGLSNIHCLTAREKLELRIDMITEDGMPKTWTYSVFQVAGPEDSYRLTIGGGQGDGGDAMVYHNGMQFSTLDVDNDFLRDSRCAYSSYGAWWYNACYRANLNGPHTVPALPGVNQQWLD